MNWLSDNFFLFLMLFLIPVLFLVVVYLISKNRQKIPRISLFLASLFIGSLGVFILFYTYSIFTQDQAILPLRMAAPFHKLDHPISFVFFTILNFVIGLILFGGGVRAMITSITKKDFQFKNGAPT